MSPAGDTDRIRKLAPGHERRVRLQCQRMYPARRNGSHPAEVIGYGALAIFVITPGDHGPIRLQRKAIVDARGNSKHLAKAAGDSTLAVKIASPGNDCVVSGEH